MKCTDAWCKHVPTAQDREQHITYDNSEQEHTNAAPTNTQFYLDPIPTSLLKKVIQVFGELFLNIINSSAHLGHILRPLK